jgi:hypothetical protein
MTHRTNLFAGWWVYIGLAGLGLVLFLLSYGGVYAWSGLAVLGLLAAAAIAAYVTGRGPRVTATTELSEHGVSVMGYSQDFSLSTSPIPWEEIAAVRVVPQPGYWETQLQTTAQPDTWLAAGHGLELAEEIAEVAGLSYREDLNTPTNMGVEHYWTKSDA